MSQKVKINAGVFGFPINMDRKKVTASIKQFNIFALKI